jgi:hypothetical protein
MKERARKYIQALKPSLIRALKQYQTTIIATHVPPYELHGPMARTKHLPAVVGFHHVNGFERLPETGAGRRV